MCNGYTGEGDAAVRLTMAFLYPETVSNPDVRIWYSDELTIPEIAPWNYEYGLGPRGYRAFYHYGIGQFSFPQCCSPEELEFYMSGVGIPFIIDDNLPSSPEGLEFESIIVDGWSSPGVNYWQEAHFSSITYGIRHQTSVPASTL
jgi:hypothetical protein